MSRGFSAFHKNIFCCGRNFMTINERINEIRLALGLTQAKFAERIAISASYYADIERSDKKVNDRIIRLIGTEFGISEHWIRTGEGEMYGETAEANIAKAVSLFKSFTPDFQECILKVLDVFADYQNSHKQ
jgi:transcriptional regulator with XRE-family HTH domain